MTITRLKYLFASLMMLAGALALAAGTPPAITGTWEGESKCTVPDSPCHDEHVVYEIKEDTKAAGQYSIDAYKIVSGERAFMGTLPCRYPSDDGTLRCVGRRPDDIWIFTVTSDRMTGTLTIGAERQLFRRVEIARSKTH